MDTSTGPEGREGEGFQGTQSLHSDAAVPSGPGGVQDDGEETETLYTQIKVSLHSNHLLHYL